MGKTIGVLDNVSQPELIHACETIAVQLNGGISSMKMDKKGLMVSCANGATIQTIKLGKCRGTKLNEVWILQMPDESVYEQDILPAVGCQRDKIHFYTEEIA